MIMLVRRAMRSLALIPLAAVASAFTLQYKGTLPPPASAAKGFESISTDDCRTWLGFLAGPECEGRGTGQPGYQKAADYMAARFKEFGLKPIGDNGTYFQMVPFSRMRVQPEGSFLQISGKGSPLEHGKDFSLRSPRGNLDVAAPLAFLVIKGDKAVIPSADELKGKIVVVMAENANRRLRFQLMQSAAGMLQVTDKIAPSNWSVQRGAIRIGDPVTSFSGSISSEAAKRLANQAGIDSSQWALEGVAADTAKLVGTEVTARASAKIQVEAVNVPNVVGMIEGTQWKDEHVGIGAHLDHMGVSNGVVYPGADDDGSGSTALIAVAKAFSKNPVKPKRSIVFMAFCGEEMGLIGSGFYADKPFLPLDKMTCELQMDMVGRNSFGAQNGDPNRMDVESENVDTIRLVGSKRISTELDAIVQDLNTKHIGFKFKYDGEDVYGRSDHYNFARKGVPIAFLFSGFHPDYHQPTDTIDKINFDKIANAAKLFYLVAHEAANRPEMLKRDVKG